MLGTVTAFSGFDSYAPPSDDQMSWLMLTTNLAWCGYYLAPAPSHHDMSWAGKRTDLVESGWGIAPIYVGQQLSGPGSHVVTEKQGWTDGLDAVSLMVAEGFPVGSFAYLDIEVPASPGPQDDYIFAWADAVRKSSFGAGVYCSHLIASRAQAMLPDARIWAYKVTTTNLHDMPGTAFSEAAPAYSGFPLAFAWQHDQSARIEVDDGYFEVDLSTALTADPSAPA